MFWGRHVDSVTIVRQFILSPIVAKYPKFMATTGKLEIVIKITELPEAKTVDNGLQYFELDCNGRIFSVTVKPKVWKKLTDAQANFPIWVGAIAGQLGAMTPGGFILDQPNIQVSLEKTEG